MTAVESFISAVERIDFCNRYVDFIRVIKKYKLTPVELFLVFDNSCRNSDQPEELQRVSAWEWDYLNWHGSQLRILHDTLAEFNLRPKELVSFMVCMDEILLLEFEEGET